MNGKTATITFATAFLLTAAAMAQAPAKAPTGSTGLCNDGSYWSGPTKSGACAGHNGVKDWYGAAATTPAKPTPVTAAKPAAETPAKTTPATPATTAAKPATTAAAGGGPGMVWVNTPTKVYHCPGSQYYGKTKVGTYMSEQAAVSAGNHADGGKACK